MSNQVTELRVIYSDGRVVTLNIDSNVAWSMRALIQAGLKAYDVLDSDDLRAIELSDIMAGDKPALDDWEGVNLC